MSFRATVTAVVVGTFVFAIPWMAGWPVAAAPQTRAVGDFPVASEIRLGGDDRQTRLVVDFSQKIDIRAFALANPYRVVIDMPQVTFELPPKTGEKGLGLVKAFRFGLVMPGGSRMVLDLARPARIETAFVLEPANDQPARLVVDRAQATGAVRRRGGGCARRPARAAR